MIFAFWYRSNIRILRDSKARKALKHLPFGRVQSIKARLEDFEFVTNVICVYFADGTTVGHYLFLHDDFYYDENGIIHYKDQSCDEERYYHYDDKGIKHYSRNNG